MQNDRPKPNWGELLRGALTTPGTLSTCYRQFHRFSTLNQLEALMQCSLRGIQLGPLASYTAWQDKGRQVRKGEKALFLWMPINRTVKETDENGSEVERHWTEFRYVPRWFVFSQTEGKPLEPEAIPDWDMDQALAALDIKMVPFESLNGNVQGYAVGRAIAVNPLAANPRKTALHELAHVVLGHTSDERVMADGKVLARDVEELEAEAVALLAVESLGLAGAAESRGYIQHWFSGSDIPAESAKWIILAADKILKAGEVARVVQVEVEQAARLALAA